MNLTTKQKVLIGLIVIFLMIIIWELRAIYLIKFENKQVEIPFTNKTLSEQNYIQNTAEKSAKHNQPSINTAANNNLQYHQQQTIAANSIQNKAINQLNTTNNIANSNNPLLIREKQLEQEASVKTQHNQNTVVTASTNNNSQLTDADKQYIQSVVNERLAQINQHLAQNDVAIASVNTTAQNALATATAIQNNTNDRLTKDEQAIEAANNNANKALSDTNNTLAAINDRLAKDEAAIVAANKTASQTLATVSNKSDVTVPTSANTATPNVPTTPISTTTTDALLIPKDSINNAATKNQSVSPTPTNAVVNKPLNKQPASSQTTASSPTINPPKTPHHLTQLPGVYHKIMHENPASYTIQLIADSGLYSLYEYMRAYCLGYASVPLHTKHLGKNWYVLIYGQFNSVYQANVALQQFPSSALKWRPFVRKMSDVQRMITDPKGEDSLTKI